MRCWTAPVKAPFTCPNSCASKSISGSAVQLTVIKGSCDRGLTRCKAQAIISLPAPVSPVIRTVERRAPTSRTVCRIRWMMGGLEPIRCERHASISGNVSSIGQLSAVMRGDFRI